MLPRTSTIGRRNEGRKPMLRIILTAAAMLCLSQAASAQELTAEQRSACMGDYEKYCKGVAPGGGRIIACLAKESDKITPACKKVLTAAEKK
jgi:cysteine rich repeat protein